MLVALELLDVVLFDRLSNAVNTQDKGNFSIGHKTEKEKSEEEWMI